MGRKSTHSGLSRRHCTCLLVLLFLIAGGIQTFCALRAAVPALDAVRFVDLAERARSESCWTLWDATGQEPLFPLWLRAVSDTCRLLIGGSEPGWALCVQLAAGIPAALCVIPVFLLSERLVGARSALVGSLLFCSLPVVARLGAQGLSEGLFLFWFAVSVWTAVGYFQTHRRGWLAVAAVAAAMATLTRLEGAVLAPVLVFTLFVETQPLRSHSPFFARMRPLLGSMPSAALVVGLFCLCLFPFRSAAAEVPEPWTEGATGCLEADSSGYCFALKEASLRRRGVVAGTRQLVEEFAKAWNYVGLAGLIAGVWTLRRNNRGGERFIHLFWLFFGGILAFFVIEEGYLAARHLLPLVATGTACAGVGLLRLGRRPAWGLVAMAVVFGLLQTAKPLHAERSGYRFAGEWLARQRGDAKVLDTKGWTRLFSGRPTYQYDEAKTAFGDADLGFVVVDPKELTRGSPRARTLAGLLARRAEKLAEFPPSEPRVAVYRWNPGTNEDEKPNRLFF